MHAAASALIALALVGPVAFALPTASDDQALVAQVRQAVQAADVPALAATYRAPSDAAARALAAMALERIHGNYAASSADAAVCERALFDTRPNLAFFCAMFANGNQRLAVGTAVATPAEAAIATRFAGHVAPARLAAIHAYVAEHAGAPAFRVDLPATDFTLPLVHLPGDDRGALEVKAGDAGARLVVDTGADFPIVDAPTAKRLGVRLLGRKLATNGFASRGVALEAGVLDRLAIGPVTLHNVPVAVGATRVNLIGLDVLRHLGAFRISRGAITVYRTAATQPACNEPLLLAGDILGHSVRATVALPIDGRLQTTLIDTGNSAYLAGDKATLDDLALSYGHRVGMRDVSGRLHASRVGQANATVQLAGHAINLTFGVFEDASLPWHYVLGSGALADMDFYFDFPGRHSCQLPHANLR